uniref:Ribosomal RNA small subunit methyltransferase H n=1 Tax=Magnetococcus massalia (strain MO-1) TaxID=451514 RepID=A0A1S7LIM2_MAGMO|nr:S-adenosyl-dependent methyl transferase [Candidatus Magnetococcus massalia]
MSDNSPFHHITVLREETVAALQPRPDGLYLDGTFGGGGHSRLLLERCAPTGRVIGLDQDLDAIHNGQPLVDEMAGRLQLIHTPFEELKSALATAGIDQIDGVMLDLGVSSHQLDRPERGFSFREAGPLDMRMDQQSDLPTAADLLNTLDQEPLADIFYHYGEERNSRRIARMIVESRSERPFETTLELAERVARVQPNRSKQKIHPATRVFQALRIAVNGELKQLEQALADLIPLLRPGGRMAVISFHSLEDRIVKQCFRNAAKPPEDPLLKRLPVRPGEGPLQGPKATLKVITGKPIIASEAEVAANPRARSAKLRVAEKC